MLLEKRSNESISRQAVREIIISTVGREAWKTNQRITTLLQIKFKEHALQNHLLLQYLGNGEIDLEMQKLAHLEFANAFSQPFTDLLLSTMLDTNELYLSQGAKGQMSARFLLGLNLLEEMGFTLDPKSEDNISTPLNAHYLKLLQSIEALGVTEEQRDTYKTTEATKRIVEMMFRARGNLLNELTFLTVAESLFPLFSGLWAQSVNDLSETKTNHGFHDIHIDDEEGNNIEDDHGGDAWHLLTQALSPEREEEVSIYMDEWLDAISGFLDGLVVLFSTNTKKN